jgi:peptidoglycan/xylan/chitin deacetylase (PgdA/CDA1 family)
VSDLLVLCYHAVSPTWDTALSVTPERFAEQLRHLAGRGYDGTTFTSAITERAPGRRVAVTFDDGYLSNLELAKPILDELGWPATVFVPTDHVGTGRPMAWPGIEEWLGTPDERELIPMDWAQLNALREAGWEIGSHTCSHPFLTRLDDAALDRELREAKAICERETGRECPSIAYPYGDVDDRVADAARVAGHRVAAALPPARHVRSALQWPRVGVYHDDDLRRFRTKTSRPLRALQRSPAWDALAVARRLRR